MPVERRIIEAVNSLDPDKQQIVLKLAEFLSTCQDANAMDKAQIETFLRTGKSMKRQNKSVNLAERGIDVVQAEILRSQLQAFAEDWNRPEMAIYDEL